VAGGQCHPMVGLSYGSPVNPWITLVFSVLQECTAPNHSLTALRSTACPWLKFQ
jgi:hypothetical protein